MDVFSTKEGITKALRLNEQVNVHIRCGIISLQKENDVMKIDFKVPKFMPDMTLSYSILYAYECSVKVGLVGIAQSIDMRHKAIKQKMFDFCQEQIKLLKITADRCIAMSEEIFSLMKIK